MIALYNVAADTFSIGIARPSVVCLSSVWGLGPHLTNVARAEAYLHAKFHLDPSNRLATIHQRHRQTDRQDRTGQTDRQTVAQNVA